MSAATSYDSVLYPSHACAETHPDRLATLATLFGLSPAPVERCRVLELGCGDGGNLLAMAFALPGSTFVGVDLALAWAIDPADGNDRRAVHADIGAEAGEPRTIDDRSAAHDEVV